MGTTFPIYLHTVLCVWKGMEAPFIPPCGLPLKALWCLVCASPTLYSLCHLQGSTPEHHLVTHFQTLQLQLKSFVTKNVPFHQQKHFVALLFPIFLLPPSQIAGNFGDKADLWQRSGRPIIHGKRTEGV